MSANTRKNALHESRHNCGGRPLNLLFEAEPQPTLEPGMSAVAALK